MKCPSCKTVNLKAMRLDDGLPVHGCAKCGGAIIPLLSYRDWSERTAHNIPGPQEFIDVGVDIDQDSRSALACPKCAKIMTKYHISGCTKNRLDLCDGCDEAWLDNGEWELLKALELAKKIPKIFTDSWQSKVQDEISETKLKERFGKLIGDADIDKADKIRSWLNSHKKRTEILFYISHK